MATVPFFSGYANCMIDFGKGINAFMDDSNEIIAEYSTPRYMDVGVVLRCIKHTLLDNGRKRLDDPCHPFNKYADVEASDSVLIRRLARDIMDKIQEARLRNAVLSLFHSGGVNRDCLDTLMECWWEYVDKCIIEEG